MVSKKIDQWRIKEAIRAAERETSAEICVSIAPYFWGNVLTMAQKAFVRLKLHRTPERNAVLFFVVPWRRQFVLWGDVGIHARLGQRDWDSIVFKMVDRFEIGRQTDALEYGIRQIGVHLARYFPASLRPVAEMSVACENSEANAESSEPAT